MSEYQKLKTRLARGWNTWNTRSVLSHVLLPEGFALNIGFKEFEGGEYLKESLIGREKIHPGMHAYDGSYTELTLEWKGIEVSVQSAIDGDDLLLLITPSKTQLRPPLAVIETGMLWNRPGLLSRADAGVTATLPNTVITVYSATAPVEESGIAAQTPYLALPLTGPVGISTGTRRTLNEISEIVERNRQQTAVGFEQYGELAEVAQAVQTSMAWDTIYEPQGDRVVSTVSRGWNCGYGGYILFCWDTYFGGYLASLDHKDLAYANVIEITREKTESGFVPNFSTAIGTKSRDRSQPPVGAWTVWELYQRFQDKWLLEEVFDDLVVWNRWWEENRRRDGYLVWGSNPYTPVVNNFWESHGVNERFGAALESGLDNSPMYDEMRFDPQTHQMLLADVGLISLYVWDCEALAKIAEALGHHDKAMELQARGKGYSEKLKTLWDDAFGLFLNRRTDTGEMSKRLSPTLFYPLLTDVPTQLQAERMIAEHFYNPEEFWGEWIMPSIARNDPAYPDQDYWRGRIWAPMNFLVYLGLRRHGLTQAARDLAEKSQALLLKEWREHGHVHENYSGDTGEGCNKPNSDPFYHWGALLGMVALLDKEIIPLSPNEEAVTQQSSL